MNTFIFIYLFCGLLATIYTFGTTFAYFQTKYSIISDKRENYGFALVLSMVALVLPFIAIVPFTMSGFNKHGWRIK